MLVDNESRPTGRRTSPHRSYYIAIATDFVYMAAILVQRRLIGVTVVAHRITVPAVSCRQALAAARRPREHSLARLVRSHATALHSDIPSEPKIESIPNRYGGLQAGRIAATIAPVGAIMVCRNSLGETTK